MGVDARTHSSSSEEELVVVVAMVVGWVLQSVVLQWFEIDGALVRLLWHCVGVVK